MKLLKEEILVKLKDDLGLKKKILASRGKYFIKALDKFLDISKLENTQVFIDLKVPYFKFKVFYNNLNNNTVLIEKDILLKDYDFNNIIDCTVAHQEISMFLPIINNIENNDINNSDTTKRDFHGFNDISFKSTKPGDKKTRRKLNKKRKHG